MLLKFYLFILLILDIFNVAVRMTLIIYGTLGHSYLIVF